MWRSLRDACRDAPFGTNQRYITWLKDVRRKVRLAGPDGRITRRISDENYGRLVRAAAGFSLRRERERRWALRADCREDGQAGGYDAPELIRRQGVVRAFKGLLQLSGNAGGYWVDFLSRGEPPCPNQYALKKASRHLTAINCNSSWRFSNKKEGSLMPRLSTANVRQHSS